MANTINTFDFAGQTLAQFLATVVDNGTQADLFQTLKVDASGDEARATQIAEAAGQLYGNGVDDFVLAAYPLLRQIALGGGGGDYESTLAAGRDSGANEPFHESGTRPVLGATTAQVSTIGEIDQQYATYGFRGSHRNMAPAGGGEAAGDYVVDPIDLCSINAALFGVTVIIEWEGFRWAANGFDPPTLRGYATAKEIWDIPDSSLPSQTSVVYSDVEKFSGFDCIRIAEGSTSDAIAFEILEGPTGSGPPIFWSVFYTVRMAGDATAF